MLWSFVKGFWPVLLLAVLPAIVKTLWVYVQFKGSSYGAASGIGFWKTILDKGAYGEFLTYRILEKVPGDKRLLANVYVPREDGTTTEVDVVMINEVGIFALESKNYSGWIHGNENNKMWTQTFKNGLRSLAIVAN